MRCFRLLSNILVISYLVVHVCAMRGDEKGHEQLCRYWCRTIDHRYYCCPSGKAESWPEHVWHSYLYPWLWTTVVESPFYPLWPEILFHEKETTKHCPPLRTHCPRTYDWYSPLPSLCHDDEDCSIREKCCYDICLEHKTCKTAE